MSSRLRRLVGSGQSDTAGVLASAQYSVALRTAIHQHYGRQQIADTCFQLSQQYELELSTHLDHINKGGDQ